MPDGTSRWNVWGLNPLRSGAVFGPARDRGRVEEAFSVSIPFEVGQCSDSRVYNSLSCRGLQRGFLHYAGMILAFSGIFDAPGRDPRQISLLRKEL